MARDGDTVGDPVYPARSSQTGRLFLWVLRHRVPVLGKLLRILLGCDIYCPLPEVLYLPHPYGIVIHHNVRLGEGIVIEHQVTIGQAHPTDPGVPRIGDGAFLGAGSKIIGDVEIGAGAMVGANAVVTRDVPADATVVGANRILT